MLISYNNTRLHKEQKIDIGNYHANKLSVIKDIFQYLNIGYI